MVAVVCFEFDLIIQESGDNIFGGKFGCPRVDFDPQLVEKFNGLVSDTAGNYVSHISMC